MQISLEGKVALVTGASRGIGRAVAEAYAAAGAAVMLSSRKQEALEEAAKTMAGDVDVYAANAGEPDQIAACVAATMDRFGRVDILVNNAGIQHVAPIEEFPPAKWDAIIAINLSAAFHAIRAALPGMKAQGWGRIVNIASAHGLIGSPFKSAYVAAKHGIVGLTKVVALETAENGITCNAVCPGYVRTPLVEKQIDDQAKAHNVPHEQVIRDVLLKQQPNKRFATVEEIGALVAFLCSEAGASITGTALAVDGGWTAH
jgi:3-hydroxybutyrate dehydrogenase